MKKVIPFSKEIDFKTMISKVTSLSLEHTLRVNDDNSISGDFIVEGTYKMTQASQIDENFSYKIPIDISIDDKYNTDDLSIDIEDFNYEVIDEEKLLLNISLCIDNLEEKQEILQDIMKEDSIYEELNTIENVRNDETIENLFKETTIEKKLEVPTNVNNMDSLVSILNENDEVFTTYSVYIVKEEDSLDTIQEKYKVTREELEEYNDLSNIKIGSKVLIPCSKNE